MEDYSKYSTEELQKMRETSYSEYYKLATAPCVKPSKRDLKSLEIATEKYEAICNEIQKRVNKE